MKRLLGVLVSLIVILPSVAHAQYTHALASTLTCTNQGGSIGSNFSTDVFIGTLSGNLSPALPAVGSNCTPRDHVEIFATQGTNQAYSLLTIAGAGTAVKVPSNGGVVMTIPPSGGGATDVVLHQIWVYNATPSTPEWELVTQETQPSTVTPPGVSINVKTDSGAVGDGVIKFDGAMSGSSSTLTSASNPFTSTVCTGGSGCTGTVNKLICVAKTAVGGVGQKCGTITSYTSAGQVGLSFSAGAGVTNAWFQFGTDDLAAFNNACIALGGFGGGTLTVPRGIFMLSGQWNCGVNYTVRIQGTGAALVVWGYNTNGHDQGLAVNNPNLATYITFATTTLSGPALNVNRDLTGGNTGVTNNVFRTDISDLTLWGGVGYGHDGGGADGMKFTDAPWITLTHVYAGNFAGYAFNGYGNTGLLQYLSGITIDSSWLLLNGLSGFTVSKEVQNLTIKDSEIDNNVQNGLYLDAPIWTLNITGSNIQRNNINNSVSPAYYQIYADPSLTAPIQGCLIAGDYFEDDGGSTLVANQTSIWSCCEWDGGSNFASGALSADAAFQPLFSGNGATKLSSCIVGSSGTKMAHVRQCVTDGASGCPRSTTPGNSTYPSGGGAGSQYCQVQSDVSGLWNYTGAGCY